MASLAALVVLGPRFFSSQGGRGVGGPRPGRLVNLGLAEALRGRAGHTPERAPCMSGKAVTRVPLQDHLPLFSSSLHVHLVFRIQTRPIFVLVSISLVSS